MSRSKLGRALTLSLAMSIAPATLLAQEQSRVAFLADQLKNGADFRVRTQAALALGASDDAEAVQPLCDALDDANDTVRSAAAAGLGKLGKKEGLPCLKRHEGESSASVKSVIARSIKSFAGASAGGAAAGGSSAKPPPPGPNDTTYVAIGTTTDKTGRGGTAVHDVVRGAMQSKLLSLGGYAVAPSGESAGAARGVLAKNKKLKGFMLQVAVQQPEYSGSDLTIQVRVTMWSYPGKALQGEFSPKLTMSGVTAGDASSEDNLIRMAVERAVDSFVQVAASMN